MSIRLLGLCRVTMLTGLIQSGAGWQAERMEVTIREFCFIFNE